MTNREHYFLKCRELEKENEELKQQHRKLQIDFNDACGIVYDLRESKLDLEDENEQLKQQLIDVDKLIDDKIKEYQKYDGYDTEKYYIGTQLLKELKKELKGDVE